MVVYQSDGGGLGGSTQPNGGVLGSSIQSYGGISVKWQSISKMIEFWAGPLSLMAEYQSDSRVLGSSIQSDGGVLGK